MNTTSLRIPAVTAGLAGVLAGVAITLVSTSVRYTILAVVGVCAAQLYIHLSRVTIRDEQIHNGQLDERSMRSIGLMTGAAQAFALLTFIPGPANVVLAMIVTVLTLFHVSAAQLWLGRQWDEHQLTCGSREPA